MFKVRGSQISRIRVVEYRARVVIAMLAFALAAVVMGLALSFYFGKQQAHTQQQQTSLRLAQLSEELSSWRERAQEYEQLYENTKTASEVDRQASEDVRQQIIALKSEVSQLGEENAYYKGLMTPNETQNGLVLGAVELVKTRDQSAYEYKIVIEQRAKRHNVLTGYAEVNVRGRQDGVETVYPLAVLSDAVESEKIKLRFKYFQVVKGRMGLPEGFEPEGLLVEAKTTGRDSQIVSKNFGWLAEEV